MFDHETTRRIHRRNLHICIAVACCSGYLRQYYDAVRVQVTTSSFCTYLNSPQQNFSRRRLQVSLGPVETTAVRLLMTLAVSDLFFCMVVIPQGALRRLEPSSINALYYYMLYIETALNFLLSCSSWLITILAVHRFMYLRLNRYYLHISTNRWRLNSKHMIGAVIGINALFNAPIWFADY